MSKVSYKASIWERAFCEGKKVQEKISGIQAEVIRYGKTLYHDEGTDTISPVSEFTQDDFFIVE